MLDSQKFKQNALKQIASNTVFGPVYKKLYIISTSKNTSKGSSTVILKYSGNLESKSSFDFDVELDDRFFSGLGYKGKAYIRTIKNQLKKVDCESLSLDILNVQNEEIVCIDKAFFDIFFWNSIKKDKSLWNYFFQTNTIRFPKVAKVFQQISAKRNNFDKLNSFKRLFLINYIYLNFFNQISLKSFQRKYTLENIIKYAKSFEKNEILFESFYTKDYKNYQKFAQFLNKFSKKSKVRLNHTKYSNLFQYKKLNFRLKCQNKKNPNGIKSPLFYKPENDKKHWKNNETKNNHQKNVTVFFKKWKKSNDV